MERSKNMRLLMSKLHTACVPKEITITPQSFCSYAEETKFFAGTESYRKELEADVKLSGNGGQLFKFS